MFLFISNSSLRNVDITLIDGENAVNLTMH